MKKYDTKERDLAFIESLVNLEKDIEILKYQVKEKFGIDSEFDKETLTLKLICNNVNESFNVMNARDYIYTQFDEDEIAVKF